MKRFLRFILSGIILACSLLPIIQSAPVKASTTVTFMATASSGYIYKSTGGMTYENTRIAPTGTGASTGSVGFVSAYLDGSSVWNIERSFVFFDTSSLSSYTITSAELQIYVVYPFANDDADTLRVQGGMPSYPNDPMVLGDYLYTHYSGDYGDKTLASMTGGAYNTITLTANGIAAINKSGTTKFALRLLTSDINDTEPSGTNQLAFMAAGSSVRAKLVVTYVATTTYPQVSTQAPTNVTTSNATGNGVIDSIGSENATLRGVEWGTTTGVYTSNNTEVGNFGIGAFTGNITGLSAGITYYYRALAQNSYGTGYGAEVSFTAYPSTPYIVVTAGVANINPTYATLQGSLTDMGLSNYTSVSFEYGTTTSYGTVSSETTLTAIGDFSIQITGLTFNTLYHYRARARYGLYYAYGGDMTFTTLSAIGSSTDLRIISVAVFSNYLTTGDLLFAAEVSNYYSGYYPNQDPKRYFTIQLLDLNNTDILGATPLPFWGDRPVSIYVRPAQAAALLEGGAYYIRMISYLISGTPSVEKQITENDWYGYDFIGALDDWAKGVAFNMEISDGRADYLTNLTDQGVVITDAAGGYFTIGMPGIGTVRPNLFTTTEATPQISVGTANNIWDKLDTDLAEGWRHYVGANIANDIDTMATPFGVSGKDLASGLIGLVMLGCMMVVVGGTGGFGALGAILLALPILWLGFYFRIVPSQVIVAIVVVFSLLAIRQFIVKTL